MNPLPEDFIVKVRQLRLIKLSFSQIAEKLQCTKNQVEHAARLGDAVKKRLTEEQKQEIIAARLWGVLIEDLAEKYQVNRTTISHILKDTDASHLKTDKQSVIKDYRSGMSYSDMSMKYGLTERSLGSIITRSGASNKRRLTDEEFESLIKDRNLGLKVAELAVKYNLSVAGVKTILLRNKIVIPDELKQKNIDDGRRKNFLESRGVASQGELMSDYASKNEGKYTGTYTDSYTNTDWECKKGHTFKMRPNAVQQGQWCPKCANTGPSAGQLEIDEYVRSLGFETKVGDRDTIVNEETGCNLELDVYIPSKKFGIEYNGLIWHSELYQKDAKRHMKKALACRASGIKLLAIFEDEWKNNKELIKGMIRSRLGIYNVKLRASELELIRLDKNSDFKDFFLRNHLDGYTLAKHAYGLKYKGKLVACLSIRTNHNSELEIARMAFDYDYHIHGGASRLIKAALKEHGRLVTFSNNRLSTGDIYRKVNAKLLQENTPSYWYTDGTSRHWRFKFKRINDPELLAKYPHIPHTESDQAAGGLMSLGIWGDMRACYKIHDYGHIKWLLETEQ